MTKNMRLLEALRLYARLDADGRRAVDEALEGHRPSGFAPPQDRRNQSRRVVDQAARAVLMRLDAATSARGPGDDSLAAQALDRDVPLGTHDVAFFEISGNPDHFEDDSETGAKFNRLSGPKLRINGAMHHMNLLLVRTTEGEQEPVGEFAAEDYSHMQQIFDGPYQTIEIGGRQYVACIFPFNKED